MNDDLYGKRVATLDLNKQKAAPSYNVIGKAKPSMVHELISNLPSNKEMLILHEIMSPPKSLRADEDNGIY